MGTPAPSSKRAPGPSAAARAGVGAAGRAGRCAASSASCPPSYQPGAPPVGDGVSQASPEGEAARGGVERSFWPLLVGPPQSCLRRGLRRGLVLPASRQQIGSSRRWTLAAWPVHTERATRPRKGGGADTPRGVDGPWTPRLSETPDARGHAACYCTDAARPEQARPRGQEVGAWASGAAEGERSSVLENGRF